jgi:hypothetical protein
MNEAKYRTAYRIQRVGVLISVWFLFALLMTLPMVGGLRFLGFSQSVSLWCGIPVATIFGAALLWAAYQELIAALPRVRE